MARLTSRLGWFGAAAALVLGSSLVVSQVRNAGAAGAGASGPISSISPCRGPPGARPGGGDSALPAVECGLEIRFLLQPDELLGHLPALEQDDRRDRVDPVLHRDLAVGVRVHLAH